MGKLRTLSGREIAAILQSNGFVFVSRESSHLKLRKTLDDGTVLTVIVPDHKMTPIGTLHSIIRQSGLGRGPFES